MSEPPKGSISDEKIHDQKKVRRESFSFLVQEGCVHESLE